MYREPAATPATAKAARAPRNICTSMADMLEAQCESFNVLKRPVENHRSLISGVRAN